LTNPNGLTDVAHGLVMDGGEVEDYSFFITPACPTGNFGTATLCITAEALPESSNVLLVNGTEPDCDPAPAPLLLGFSADADPLTGCEFPVVAPGSWCGTGGMLAAVANSGPANLSGVTVTYLIPTNGVFAGATASQGTVTQYLGTVT